MTDHDPTIGERVDAALENVMDGERLQSLNELVEAVQETFVELDRILTDLREKVVVLINQIQSDQEEVPPDVNPEG